MKCAHCNKVIDRNNEDYDYWIHALFNVVEYFHTECENKYLKELKE